MSPVRLVITTDKTGSSTTKGDVTYTVKAGDEVAFDEDDFKKVYDNSNCTGSSQVCGIQPA